MLISVWTLRIHFCLYLFSQTRSRKVEHWLWFISWKSSCCLCLLGFCLPFCTVTLQFSGFSCVVGRILRWPFGGGKKMTLSMTLILEYPSPFECGWVLCIWWAYHSGDYTTLLWKEDYVGGPNVIKWALKSREVFPLVAEEEVRKTQRMRNIGCKGGFSLMRCRGSWGMTLRMASRSWELYLADSQWEDRHLSPTTARK